MANIIILCKHMYIWVLYNFTITDSLLYIMLYSVNDASLWTVQTDISAYTEFIYSPCRQKLTETLMQMMPIMLQCSLKSIAVTCHSSGTTERLPCRQSGLPCVCGWVCVCVIFPCKREWSQSVARLATLALIIDEW